MSAYDTLKSRWHQAARLDQAAGLLHWDQAVLMPPAAAQARGDQLATLAQQSHEVRTRADMVDLLAAAQDEDLDAWDRRNLELIDWSWRKQAALPQQLVADLSAAALAAEVAWGKARDADDFSLVQGDLQRSFDLTKERASRLSHALGGDPYDLLMDDFEPGLTQDLVDPIFQDYAAFLPDFLAKVQARQARDPSIIRPQGPFDLTTQERLSRALIQTLGFDFDGGRLDVSRHPFCGGYPGDIRLTTRYDEADFTKALMGVIHETGHGLYEAGLPPAYATQPVGAAAGLVAHESQSLLMEMQAGRSDGFLRYLTNEARQVFEGQGPAWEVDNLIRLYRRVAPGCIRVDADEVTYPAHVILRYDLEKALFKGRLEVADLPTAFAEGLEALLGQRPVSDVDSVLQDIHWYSGGFGYFPTYTLGALAAAQLFAAASAALAQDGGTVEEDLAQGDFTRLLAWLRTHVHSRGAIGNSNALLTAATGRPLDPTAFKQHLARRYLGEGA